MSVTELIRRSEAMFNRGSQESLWQMLAENYYPERATFTTEFNDGREFTDHLFDATPVLLRRDLGNAFSAMLRPRGQPWFRAAVAYQEQLEDKQAAAEFFDHVTEVTRNVLYDGGSKFVRATKEADHDYATFGAAVISVDLNQSQNGLRFQNHHLKDCAWAENYEGDIDTLHRRMRMTARQIQQKFPDSVPRDVQVALNQNNFEQKFDVRHIMMPADDYGDELPKDRRIKDAPYVSIYVCCTGDKAILRQSSSWEFNYVVPRWQTISGSVYPVSPAAMTGLPDARMVQAMARVMLEAAEKQIDPPLAATEDAVIGDVNLAAGGITWIDARYDERLGPGLRPIELGKNVNLGVDMLNYVIGHLYDTFYISKLTLPEAGEKTAYEVARRVEEYVRAAAPLFEPLETEYNTPLLDLVASKLIRLGAYDLDLMPPEIQGESIEWAFANPLQDALEKNKLMALTTIVEQTSGMGASQLHSVPDFKGRDAFRDMVLATGAPASWLLSREEADAQAEQMQQAAEMQQMTAEAGAMGEAGQSIAGALETATQ